MEKEYGGRRHSGATEQRRRRMTTAKNLRRIVPNERICDVTLPFFLDEIFDLESSCNVDSFKSIAIVLERGNK